MKFRLSKSLTFLFCSFSLSVFSQLSGNYSVPGSFNSIAAVIQSLNSYGVVGPVTINISAGYTETVTAGGYSLYAAVGNSSINTITFQKSGNGVNPILYSYSGGVATASSLVQDGIWRFIGTDNMTIDGIDLFDANTSAGTGMEFGFGFFKANSSDGCQNNTIRNCSVKLYRFNNASGLFPAYQGSRGIEFVNAIPSAHTTSLNITAASGSHSNNRLYNNLIYDCHIGITFIGSNTTSIVAESDINNDIGGLTAATGNTIINFGGGGTLTASSGIQTYGQYNINVSNNLIDNNYQGMGSRHQTTLRGIYLSSAQGANVSIKGNTITLAGIGSTVQISCIENSSGISAPSNTINISNNLIASCSMTANSNGPFYGIFNSAPASQIICTGNTFTNNSNAAITGTSALILNTGEALNSVNISNNNFSYWFTGQHNGYHFGILHAAGSRTSSVNFNNNVFSNYNASGANSASRYHFIWCAGTNSTVAFINNSWNSLTITTQGGFNLMLNASSSEALVTVLNNSVTGGFLIPGLAGDFQGYVSSGFSSANTNVTITGNNFSGVTANGYGNGSFNGINYNDVSRAPYANVQIYNNIISNVLYNGQGGVNGIYANYLGGGSLNVPSAVYNNTITNIDAWGRSEGLIANASNSPVYRTVYHHNLVSNITAREDGDWVYGAYLQCQGTGIDFCYNKIINIIHTGTITSHAVGIRCLSGTGTRLYNNIIGHVLSTNATANDATSNEATTGIDVSTGTGYKIFYNTVFLTGASRGSSCLSNSVTSAGIELKNNVLVNLCTSTSTRSAYCIKRWNTNLTGYEITSSNNLLYSGIPGPNNILLQLGSNSYTTLALAQATLLGREWNSVTENPNFMSIVPSSLDYLVPSSGTPTQIESNAAIIIGANDDINGTLRNTPLPDLGAFEGSFTPATNDQQPPSILQYAFIGPVCNPTQRTFTANLSDVSGIATGTLSPRVYYRVNSQPYISVNGTLTAGSNTLGTWSFNLTYSATPGDVISTFLVAQDNSTLSTVMGFPANGLLAIGVNTVTSFPSNPLTYTTYGYLGGTYTVGTAGTFTSLTAASRAYNTSCLTSSVTFVLTDAQYASNETFPIEFKKNMDASPTKSVLIIPAPGSSVIIQRANTNSISAMFKYTDASYITIDGLNTSGSSLSVVDNYTFNYTAAGIWIASAGKGNKHLTFTNLTIRTNATNDYSYGILATEDFSIVPQNGNTIFGGLDNDSININNNVFLRQSYAIAAYGASVSALGGCDNWNISSNRFGPTNSSVDNIGYTAIQLRNVVGSAVISNTLCNITGSNTPKFGIFLIRGCSDLVIDKNVIRSLQYTGTSNYGPVGIYLNTGYHASNIRISNNFICDLRGKAGQNFSSGAYSALSVGAETVTGGIQLLNNSIAMNQYSLEAGVTPSAVSSAVYFGSNCVNLDVRNNIFHTNVHFGSYTTSTAYSIYSNAPAYAFSIMDNNSFYASGAQGILGYLNGNLTTLQSLRNAFGQNNSSIQFNPAFTSSVDLHIDNTNPSNFVFDNLGSPINQITGDIDSQARSLTTPDIGADEHTAISCSTALSGSLASTSSVCAGGTILLTSSGASFGTGTIYQWMVSPNSGGTYTNISLAPNASSYSLNGFASGTYYVVLNTTCPSLSLTNTSNEMTLSVVPPTTLNISSSQSLSCQGSPVTLSVSGAGTYNWSTGSSGASVIVTPLMSTAYSVTAINAPCPSLTSSIIIYSGPNPTISVSSQNFSLCFGESTTLTAIGAQTYTWNNSTISNSLIVSPIVTSIYTITGSAANSCTNQALITLSVLPLPYISITGGATLCAGNSLTLNAQGANSYTWTTPSASVSSSSSLAIAPTGISIYTLTGQDANGCLETVTSTVTVLSLPQVIVLSTNTIVCPGSSITLMGGGASTYSWTGGIANNLPFVPSSPNSYTVTGVSAQGCSNIAVQTISLYPSATISILATPTLVCQGGALNLNATGGTGITWSGSIQNNVAFLPINSSAYTATSVSQYGCEGIASIFVPVKPLPILNIIGSQSICVGNSVTLIVNGASTYSWNTGALTSTLLVSPLTSTVYSVYGIDIDGCMNSLNFNMGVLPQPNVSANSNTNNICSGLSVTLFGGGALTYSWTGGVMNNAPFLATASAGYTVMGADMNGCVGSGIIFLLVKPSPQLSLSTQKTIICEGESTTLSVTGGDQYLWGTFETLSSIIVSPLVSTTYTVTGTSTNGCSSKISILQMVDPCTSTNIKEAVDFIRVYPNPALDKLYITSNSFPHVLQISLVSESGQLLLREVLRGKSTTLQLEKLPSGIYFLNIISEEGKNINYKIVKE